jgi:hypothetical protein
VGHFVLQKFFLPSQITILHLDAEKGEYQAGVVILAEFFSILTECLSLETLAIYGDLIDEDYPPNFIPLDMPHLRSLQIYGDVMTVPITIAAPSLQHLVLVPLYHIDLGDVITLRQPSTPVRFPALKSLTISRVRSREPVIIHGRFGVAPQCLDIRCSGPRIAQLACCIHLGRFYRP